MPRLFINISRKKFYLEYKKNFIFLVFILYLIFIDQVANYIVNNGNILIDGKGDVIIKWVREYATDITSYNADFRRR